jgi:hypothetical protein
MPDKPERLRDYARVLLANIRIFNGAAALFAPAWMARRLGDNPNSAIIYGLRLFGVRTIIIGVDLLVPDEQRRANALRYAILIHASDTITAALAGIQGQLPRRTSILLIALSGFNTILAVLAQPLKGKQTSDPANRRPAGDQSIILQTSDER